MPQYVNSTKDNEIIIAGKHFMMQGNIRHESGNIFARKSLQGDPRPSDHPSDSEILQSSWLGGGQIWIANPDSDSSRFWISELTTWSTRGLALGPKTFDYKVGEASTIILGVFPPTPTGSLYAICGNKLLKYDDIDDEFDEVLTIAAGATNEATAYRWGTGSDKGELRWFIPAGSTYSVFDGSDLIPGEVTALEGAVDFEVWNGAIYKIDGVGVIKRQREAGAWEEVASIDDGTTPRHLFTWRTGEDRQAIHTVTNESVWVYDFDSERIMKTDLQFPPHPTQGRGFAAWRADLYISVGIGIHRQQQGLITAAGPDRDDGLPPEYNGYVQDMAPGYNDLYALVAGNAIGSTQEPEATIDERFGHTFYLDSVGVHSTLMAWNGYGWHTRWNESGKNPTTVLATSVEGKYGLWWAAGDTVYRQPLPINYYNPKLPAEVPFVSRGTHYTSWYDWGWKSIDKVLKSLIFKTYNCSPDRTITVQMQVDDEDGAWEDVAQITRNHSRLRLALGKDDLYGKDFYRGIRHERFRLRFIFSTNDETISPVIEWWGATGRKLLRRQTVLRAAVDLLYNYKGETPEQLNSFIDALIDDGRAVPVVKNNRTYMMELVAYTGEDQIMTKARSFRTVNFIEHLDGYTENDIAP